jgi:hypothetical protein
MKKNKKKRGRDVLHEVIDASGDLAVGSQLSLTQESSETHQSLAECLADITRHDIRLSMAEHEDDPNLPCFVKTCFRGSPPGDSKGLARRLQLYLALFDLARRGKQNQRNLDGLLNFWVTEASNLPVGALPLVSASDACLFHKYRP